MVRRARGRIRIAVAVCNFVLLACAVPATESGRFVGRRLVEVLEEIRRQGVNVLYSSAVVGPELIVTVEPLEDDPRAQLHAILSPLGLEAREGPGGTVLIVAAEERGSLRGRVVSTMTGRPVVRARIRLEGTPFAAEARPDGSFELSALPPGTYEALIDASGYLELPLSGVRVRAGDTTSIVLRLAPQPHLVEEVVVTPGSHAMVQEDPSAARSIGSSDALLLPAMGDDVLRVVERLPGVAAPDNSTAFHARGSLSRDVAVVLDGLELYEPFHLESFQSPFSFIDSEIVDRVDFLGGGFTAEHGDRHGGFVEITTAVPQDLHRTAIEVGTLNSRVSHSRSFPKGSLLFSGRFWYPQAVTDTVEFGEDGFDPSFLDAYLCVSHVASASTVLSAHALFAKDHVDFQETGGNETVSSRNRSGYVWFRAIQSWSSRLAADTVVSAGRLDRTRRGNSEPEDEIVTVDDRRAIDVIGISQDLSWNFSDSHLFKAGFEIQTSDADYSYRSGAPGDEVVLDPTPSGTSLAAYVSDRRALAERFAFEIGLRWDRQSHTSEEELSPRLNAVWRPNARTEFRIGVGRFFQSQRVHELQLEDGETAFHRAERSDQLDLTILRKLGEVGQIRFDAYVHAVDRVQPRYENLFNPIELFPETEADRVRIAPEHARLRGLELLVQGAPAIPLQWWVSYTWSSAVDSTNGVEVPRSWDQTHAGKFLVAYRFDSGWSTSLAGTAHTGWPTTPVVGESVTLPDGSTEIEPVLGPRNSDRFATYLRLDAKVSRTFPLRHGRLRLELAALNLTGRDNPCCVSDFHFPSPPPEGQIEAQPELSYWLGFTPSFGVLWEF